MIGCVKVRVDGYNHTMEYFITDMLYQVKSIKSQRVIQPLTIINKIDNFWVQNQEQLNNKRRLVWIVIGNMTEEEVLKLVMNGNLCYDQPLLAKEEMQDFGLTDLKGYHRVSI